MAHTTTSFATGNALTRHHWSDYLAIEAAKKAYFSRFIGKSKDHLIMIRDEMAKGKGDKVTFGLRMKLDGAGVEGDTTFAADSTASGTASEGLTFHSDYVYIDQLRKQTKSAGKMSEQRVTYNIRKEGMDALSTWWAEEIDENFFYYLSGGTSGTDSELDAGNHHAASWTGRAGNSVRAATNILYADDATSPATLASGDIFNLAVIEKAMAYAKTTDPMIQPFLVDGKKKYVCLIHTFQAFDLRTATSSNDWLEIHKATDRGDKAMMYRDALGEYAGVILHEHRNVLRNNTDGTYAVDAAQALFLGAQAGVIAYGQNASSTPGDIGSRTQKGRFTWVEETADSGNQLEITAGCIFGIQKTQFNSSDFSTMIIRTACASPF